MSNSSFRIGHYTDQENYTGCTVVLCPDENRTSCYISGSAPGSRETALLSPERKIQGVQAILLTGGSAFGLAAAQGVVQYLEENQKGYRTNYGVIPIVPAAVVFDLNLGNPAIRPSAENAYAACRAALADDQSDQRGSVGAGTGVTVGKWAGLQHAMRGGLGSAEIAIDGARVKAIAVVNSVGDIIDAQGKIIAGARSKNGFLADENPAIRWKLPEVGLAQNTVLTIIMTNVNLDKLQTYLLAKRAHNGYARAIVPANTSYDGDIVFAVSSGMVDFTPDILYDIAAEVTRRAIIDGVVQADGFTGKSQD